MKMACTYVVLNKELICARFCMNRIHQGKINYIKFLIRFLKDFVLCKFRDKLNYELFYRFEKYIDNSVKEEGETCNVILIGN